MKRLMYKFFSSRILVLLAALSVTFNGYSETIGVLDYKLNPDGTAEVTGLADKSIIELVIPSSIDFGGQLYSVSSIGTEAFAGCRGLVSVSIPESVISINRDAFMDCTGLAKAEFASIESLCRISFCNTPSNPLYYAHHLYINGEEVTNAVLPESITSIGQNAFAGCRGLVSVSIPESVISINGGAFMDCTGLAKVEFASLESLCNISFGNIPANPLYSAHHLYINGEEVTDAVLPESITSIGHYAFSGCSGLASVTIPKSITTIGANAFGGCNGLLKADFSSIESLCKIRFNDKNSNPLFSAHHLYVDGNEVTEAVIPEGVISIGSYAFVGCSGLTSVVISAGLSSIGHEAFGECGALASVSIPETVTSIHPLAFYNCISLTSVTIPQGITMIGNLAFNGCTGLRSVYYGATDPMMGDYFSFYGAYEKATLYVPEEALEEAKTRVPWALFNKIEPYDFSEITMVYAKIDESSPYEVYNLRGDKIGDNVCVLSTGIYIIRQGERVKKIVIK